MGLSLYSIPTWASDTTYEINDVYKYGTLYYYATSRHQSSSTFSSEFSDGITTFNGKTKAKFFWSPSYNSPLQIRPNVKVVQFDDGYSSSAPQGINNILLPFNLTFDKRDDNETRAILHFLNQRKGAESFVFTAPFPYNIAKLYVCRNWDFITVFVNNHTVRAEFVEVVV